MKQTPPQRNSPPAPSLPAVLLTAVLTTAVLMLVIFFTATACRPVSPTQSPPATTRPTVTSPPAETTSEESLRAYYESLIAELQQTILEDKQADYIIERDYENRIAELEAKLEALNGGRNEPPAGTDIPVAGDPAPLPDHTTDTSDPADTTPPTNPAAAFHYVVRDGQVEITAYCGASRAVTVPARVAGHPVTRIADEAFRGTAVTSVTLPETVTEIGWFAFADCPALAAVTLPASVAAIDYGAFADCPRLTIYCPQGSYAAQYAASFALRVSVTKG